MTENVKLNHKETGGCYMNIPPGQLQYKISRNTIIGLDINRIPDIDYTEGYQLTEQSKENLMRLTPNTKTGNCSEWKLILAMKVEREHHTWLKGALLNNETGEIALMSSTNNRAQILNNGSRVIHSHDEEWYIGQFFMVAPMYFWNELKNRVMYSI